MESKSPESFTAKKDSKFIVQSDYIPTVDTFDFADEDATDWLKYINENKLEKVFSKQPKFIRPHLLKLVDFIKAQKSLYRRTKILEANDLRFCLIWMATMHLLYIFIFSVSWRVIALDCFLFKLCYQSILTLKKVAVLKYIFAMMLLGIIGLTHCPYRSQFITGLQQALFIVQMMFYICASL